MADKTLEIREDDKILYSEKLMSIKLICRKCNVEIAEIFMTEKQFEKAVGSVTLCAGCGA